MMAAYFLTPIYTSSKKSLISDRIKRPLVAAFRSPLMKALDRSVETLGLWIVTFSVTFIKYVNQSSIKPCLIVHLVAMWTLIYFISEWVDRKFHMSVGQAEYAPRSNKVEDQTNSFAYARKFSYPKYRRRVIFRNKNTIDVPNFTWFKRSWTSLRKTMGLPIKKGNVSRKNFNSGNKLFYHMMKFHH